jgi:hypothetical protein
MQGRDAKLHVDIMQIDGTHTLVAIMEPVSMSFVKDLKNHGSEKSTFVDYCHLQGPKLHCDRS